MSTMIPGNVEGFTTEGEQRFYRFMETAVLPNDQFICWYTPDINGNEPDFILYSKKIGLVVFEVKDWNLEQIISAICLIWTVAKPLVISDAMATKSDIISMNIDKVGGRSVYKTLPVEIVSSK